MTTLPSNDLRNKIGGQGLSASSSIGSGSSSTTSREVGELTTNTQALAPAQHQVQEVSNKIVSDDRATLREPSYATNAALRLKHLRNVSMPERPLTMRAAMEIPIVLDTIEWSTSDAENDDIYTNLLPDCIQTTSMPLKAFLRTCAYYFTGFEIKIAINSNPFNSGALVLTLYPFDVNYQRRTYATKQGMPHVWLNASNSSNAILCAPFLHQVNFMTTNTDNATNTMARFSLSVASQLRVASGSSTSMTVSIFLMPVQSSGHVAIHDHPPNVASLQYYQDFQKIDNYLEVKNWDLIHRHANGEVLGTSDLRKLVTETSAIESLLPEPAGTVLQLVKQHLDLDDPTFAGQSDQQVSVSAFDRSSGSGGKVERVLDIEPIDSFLLPQELTGFDKPYTNLRDCMKRPGLIATVKVNSTTATSGTRLFQMPVTPLAVWASAEAGPPPKNHVTATPLAYFTQPYGFWAGGIRLNFRWVSAKATTMRIFMLWEPNVIEAAGIPNFKDSTGDNGAYLDIQELSDWSIVIPYATPTDMKVTNDISPIGYYSDQLQNSLSRPQGFSCFNGRFAIYAVSNFNHPSNTPDFGEIFIYASAAPDYYVRAITQVGNINVTMADEPDTVIETMADTDQTPTASGYQTTITNEEKQNPVTGSVIFGDGRIVNTSKESIYLPAEMDIPTLTKRPWNIGRQIITSGAVQQLRRAVTPRQNYLYDSSDTYNMFARICNYFIFWTGGMRYNFNFNSMMTEKAQLFVTHNIFHGTDAPNRARNDPPFASVTPEGGPTISNLGFYHEIFNPARSSEISVEVPMKSRFGRILVNQPSWDDDPTLTRSGCLDLIFLDAPADTLMYVYQAGADNFRLYGVTYPPLEEYSI